MKANIKSQLFILRQESQTIIDSKKFSWFLPLERLNRIKNAKQNNQWALFYSDVLVRYLASNQLNVTLDDIVFTKKTYGKPHIANYPEFHFNVSHSGAYLVVLISNHPVGVDIEEINTPNLRIARRFFLDEEQTYVFSDEELSNKRFYEIWTRKESYIKYLGKGLAVPLNSFCVFDGKLNNHFNTFEIDNCFVSTFIKDEKQSYPIIRITEDEILNYLSKF